MRPRTIAERIFSKTVMMKSLRVITAIFLLTAAAASLSAAQNTRPEDISKELEYVNGIVLKGIADGDMEQLALAHRTMSNLAISIDSLPGVREKILFSMAIAYNYVNLCPTATVLQLSESTNPTGFSFDCVERTEYFFNRAINSAEGAKILSATAMADISFLVGIGYDRLKANLSGIAPGETRKFFDLAVLHIKKSVDLGSSFDGAKTVLKRYDNEKYLTAPAIDDSQYTDLHRLLYLNLAIPDPFSEKNAAAQDTGSNSFPQLTADENTYIDYQWRFTVKKPDTSWQFSIRKSVSSFYITVKKKNPDELGGSGLNIVCRALSESDAALSPEALISKSIEILKGAGYEIKSQKYIVQNGVNAQELITVHQYQNLISKPPADAQDKQAKQVPLVSKQYMIIAVSNGIEYIISFNSLDADYAGIFPEYKLIANSVAVF
jgi:hypothetical protein